MAKRCAGLLFAVLILSACASTPPAGGRRQPASTVALGPIVVRDSGTAALCPQVKAGRPCLVPYEQAVSYCKANLSHLPTAREYADRLLSRGTKVIEKDAGPPPPAGWYFVDCLNEDGSLDAFYMNHTGYVRPAGETGSHLLWTSSSPPGHLDYAHVFYDEWGGGGGDPRDHLKSHRNAFQCIPDGT